MTTPGERKRLLADIHERQGEMVDLAVEMNRRWWRPLYVRKLRRLSRELHGLNVRDFRLLGYPRNDS